MAVKGGKKLLRKLAQLKRETGQLKRTSVEVGFPSGCRTAGGAA